MARSITLVLKGYPRLSETFIAQEIRQLERRGLEITIVSLRHPTDKQVHPIHREIKAPVIYLPEYLHQEPLRVFKGLIRSLAKPGFFKALKTWLKDFKRDPTSNRFRRFGQALVLANELPKPTQQLYAHFIHTPASVTRYTSIICDIPWSASAHAKDIWTIPQWEIKEKLDDISWLVTCTKANTEYLKQLAASPEKVGLVYHGLDFERFNTESTDTSTDTLSENHAEPKPVQLISVGRAVEKKGYDHLLNALAKLPKTLHWKFTHIGGGPLLDDLKKQAEKLTITPHIEWLGALPQETVLQHYRKADLFVLASKVIGDGDRDGLPNVLMEAQSQALCCLSTNISGIPELIENGITGLLVEQKNETELAKALENLISDPQLRQQLGNAGYQRVTKEFSVTQGIDTLMEKFQATSSDQFRNLDVKR
ncbi:glycosyltransferase family 4 protein [Motiliproteus sp. MSK22-1]|uniref:glycosyltransferase family 4 protein n=1 Tax=Motiliproteus sp. MSK22-1 TaxID=1897630 RepID=UPI000976CC66|nr:glycosyltransferase family 4 protein [Motiliproteus sp. MSK22-1]OMH39744.1 colanic acid biosynthesis glycosyltransferase WcaL [Motiliproteus sp. MSK22-1]